MRRASTQRPHDSRKAMPDQNTDVRSSQEQGCEWEPFPIECLPQPLRQFVIDVAKSIGCDPVYAAMPALAACMMAVGTSRAIRLKRTWKEYCIGWFALIGKSGTMKSAPQDYAMAHIRRREREYFKQFAQELEIFNAAELSYKFAMKEWETKGRKKNEEQPLPPDKPICIRLTVNDCTMEAMTPILADNPKGILYSVDELASFFQSMNQYRKGADASRWLELHRGGVLLVDRKTGDQRHMRIDRAAVSVSGTIQPGTAKRLFTREFFESGMIARVLLAYPPAPRKQWREDELSPEVEQAYADLIDRLLAMRHDIDDAGDLQPIEIPMSKSATLAWIDFYDAHASQQADIADDDLAAAFSKLEGYAARFTLLIHCIRVAAGDPTIENTATIDIESVNAAVKIAQWFANETKRIYSALAEGISDKGYRRLIEFIERYGGKITPNDLRRRSGWYDNNDDAERALMELQSRGFGRMESSDPHARGRPTRWFILNSHSDVYSYAPASPEEAEQLARDLGIVSESPISQTPQNAGKNGLKDKGERETASIRDGWEVLT